MLSWNHRDLWIADRVGIVQHKFVGAEQIERRISDVLGAGYADDISSAELARYMLISHRVLNLRKHFRRIYGGKVAALIKRELLGGS